MTGQRDLFLIPELHSPFSPVIQHSAAAHSRFPSLIICPLSGPQVCLRATLCGWGQTGPSEYMSQLANSRESMSACFTHSKGE